MDMRFWLDKAEAELGDQAMQWARSRRRCSRPAASTPAMRKNR